MRKQKTIGGTAASRLRLIYITAKDKRQAARIGRVLVRERLAACANIIGRIDSVYWWNGAVQSDVEAAVILKTRRALVRKLVERVKGLHSYTVPCVVSLPIDGGNGDFLQWIGRETRRGPGRHPERSLESRNAGAHQ